MTLAAALLLAGFGALAWIRAGSGQPRWWVALGRWRVAIGWGLLAASLAAALRDDTLAITLPGWIGLAPVCAGAVVLARTYRPRPGLALAAVAAILGAVAALGG